MGRFANGFLYPVTSSPFRDFARALSRRRVCWDTQSPPPVGCYRASGLPDRLAGSVERMSRAEGKGEMESLRLNGRESMRYAFEVSSKATQPQDCVRVGGGRD